MQWMYSVQEVPTIGGYARIFITHLPQQRHGVPVGYYDCCVAGDVCRDRRRCANRVDRGRGNTKQRKQVLHLLAGYAVVVVHACHDACRFQMPVTKLTVLCGAQPFRLSSRLDPGV